MEWKTTFWMDFTIADVFGEKAVRDTFKRAFKEWRDDYIYLTELVIVTNWKLWQHYHDGNDAMARLYDELYRECNCYAHEHLQGEEFQYFWRMTD